MLRQFRRLARALSRTGVLNTLVYLWKSKLLKRLPHASDSQAIGTLKARQIRYPVFFRYQSSDIQVFNQIFMHDEYALLQVPHDAKAIIDCGAYVGYSTAYFLTRFPEARVIAVEPDERNFALLKRNLAPYGDRVTAIRSAVWSHKVGLKVCPGEYVDGQEWATVVKECQAGEEPDVEAVDISSLLELCGHDQVDILKLDIEGSELEVFGRNYEGWVDRIGTFLIELHGEKCRNVFHQALASGPFDFRHSGEITFATRRPASPPGIREDR